MDKLWNFFKENILKFGIAFLIVFVPLYPKLPSVHIPHTWVYIRIEDFAIALIVLIYLLQLILKKVKLPPKIWIPFSFYWIIGLFSLIFSLIFIAPHLANFFPNVAVLSFARRIEYMSLFFVAFSTIRSAKDLKHYLIILSVTVTAFSLYAFGQRFYLDLWKAFPDFFRHFSFCFPSFQTGNEEFAKGIPLCLPQGARATSTFAGHYDLGGYLVFIIPIFVALTFALKKRMTKILMFGLTLISMMTLIFTSSRISFLAYILGVTMTLVFFKRKKFIIPFYVLSLILLLTFSGSTAKRFMETFRFTSVVTNNQGQIVGQSELPDDFKNKISDKVIANVPSQNLPVGTGYLGLPQLKAPTQTDKAIIQSALSIEEAKKLKLENGGVEISTVSGTFLIKKVIVYDISFTTRFQAEWPNAWGAMLRNPLLGSGFATITLAADNDYLRILGETGLLGLFAFLSIFAILAIVIKQGLGSVTDNIEKAYLLGIGGGVIGLFFNAVLIDVFEASKIAESLWILLGVAVGTVFLYKKDFEYKSKIRNILTSNFFTFFYLFFLSLVFYINSFKNFFVADDFTWLKWAATTNLSDLPKLFINSQGFFYRPFDKVFMYFLYTLFSFSSPGYHLVMFLVHFLIAIGVYILINRLFKNRVFSFIGAFIFLFLPSQAENIYWMSTISANLCTLFIVYGLLFWQNFRERNSKLGFIVSLLFGVLAFLSYEMAVVYPLLLVLFDLFIAKVKFNKKTVISYLPVFTLLPLYGVIRSISHTVSMGGDYAYNLPHLIPNFVGNFIGYFGLMLFGESFISLYTTTRDVLKGESVYIATFLVFGLVVLIAVLFVNKKRIEKLYKDEVVRDAVFALLFIFISLIPFLGLGNISQRYTYLASIGFAILAVIFLKKLTSFIKKDQYKTYFLIIFTVLLGSLYYYQTQIANNQWQEAGRITYRTLGYLRLYYDGKRSYNDFYFVNPPIKKANAWIFPVGLSDGIWFIYRDETIRVIKVKSVEEARSQKSNYPNTSYILAFDKNGNIYEVK